MNIARPLVEKNVYPRVEYLGLERTVASLQGDLATTGASIPRIQQAAQEIRERQAQRLAQFRAVAPRNHQWQRAKQRGQRLDRGLETGDQMTFFIR